MARSPRRVALTLVVVFARAASGDPGTARLVGPFAPEEYPQAVIDRPLTLPLSDQSQRPECDRGLFDTHGCRKRRLCTIARRFFRTTALPFVCAGCGP